MYRGSYPLLAAHGAAEIPHPGGTLLAHLTRVHTTLEQWSARPTLRTAGLYHAWYGTDGFRMALGDVARRAELAAEIGEEAEQLVYRYASCDRTLSYPHLADPAGHSVDRFTGARLRLTDDQRRDFVELTAANELDVLRANRELYVRHGAELLALFTEWRTLLSDAACGRYPPR